MPLKGFVGKPLDVIAFAILWVIWVQFNQMVRIDPLLRGLVLSVAIFLFIQIIRVFQMEIGDRSSESIE